MRHPIAFFAALAATVTAAFVAMVSCEHSAIERDPAQARLAPPNPAPADAQPWINPNAYVTDWYWQDTDAGAAIGVPSDNNSCTAQDAACATFNGVKAYLSSSGSPIQLQQPTRFHMLSPQPAGWDEIFAKFNLAHGAQAILDTTLAMGTVCSSPDGGFVTQDAGAGIRWSLAAPCSGADAGELVHDTVANSWATIEYFDGGAAILTTPLSNTLVTTPGIPTLAESAMTTGDAYSVVTHAATNLKEWDGVGGDLLSGGSSTASGTMVIGAEVVDPSGSTANPSMFPVSTLNAFTTYSITRFDARVNVAQVAGRGNASYWLGDDFVTGIVQTTAANAAVLIYGGVSRQADTFIGAQLQGDMVLESGATFSGFRTLAGSNGGVLANGAISLLPGATLEINASGVSLYGNATITGNPGSTVWCFGTCTNTAFTTGQLYCGNGASGATTGVALDAGTIVSAPLTWAQIDYQGGLQDFATGCRYTHTQ
jgi:hypothetical protein